MTLMELSVQYRANAAALRERALALEGRRRSEPEQAGRLLDSRIQQLRAMLRGFADRGMTVLISSHILGEVEQMADHIGILAGGVLGYQGGMPGRGHLEELFGKVVEKNRRGGWQA